jgi:hypothetical protein
MRTTVRSVLYSKYFICYVRDLYDTICEYITREWIGTREESVRSFATDHDIDEKTVRRIRDWKTNPYKITLYTLEKICSSRNITLEHFFGKIKR